MFVCVSVKTEPSFVWMMGEKGCDSGGVYVGGCIFLSCLQRDLCVMCFVVFLWVGCFYSASYAKQCECSTKMCLKQSVCVSV